MGKRLRGSKESGFKRKQTNQSQSKRKREADRRGNVLNRCAAHCCNDRNGQTTVMMKWTYWRNCRNEEMTVMTKCSFARCCHMQFFTLISNRMSVFPETTSDCLIVWCVGFQLMIFWWSWTALRSCQRCALQRAMARQPYFLGPAFLELLSGSVDREASVTLKYYMKAQNPVK